MFFHLESGCCWKDNDNICLHVFCNQCVGQRLSPFFFHSPKLCRLTLTRKCAHTHTHPCSPTHAYTHALWLLWEVQSLLDRATHPLIFPPFLWRVFTSHILNTTLTHHFFNTLLHSDTQVHLSTSTDTLNAHTLTQIDTPAFSLSHSQQTLLLPLLFQSFSIYVNEKFLAIKMSLQYSLSLLNLNLLRKWSFCSIDVVTEIFPQIRVS